MIFAFYYSLIKITLLLSAFGALILPRRGHSITLISYAAIISNSIRQKDEKGTTSFFGFCLLKLIIY